jgi:hypothetical protein
VVQQVVDDRFLHQQPAARAAHVALVEENAVDDALDRLVQRGVVEHDVGRLAPQLQRHLLAGAGHRAGDLPAHLGRPGERHLVHPRVLDQRPAGVARPGHDVDDAGRQVGLAADVGEGQRGQWGGLGRLEDHRVATRQRRSDLPGQHEQREVPGDDLRGHAQGPGIGAEAGMVQLVGPARVVEEVRRHQRQVDVAALPDGLAVVDRLQHRELPRALLEDAGQPVQVLAPGPGGQAGPGAVVGGAGRGHRPVDVLGAGGRHLGQHLLGGRVDGLEPGAVDGVDHLAADVQAVAGGDVDDRRRLGGGGVVEAHQSNVK